MFFRWVARCASGLTACGLPPSCSRSFVVLSISCIDTGICQGKNSGEEDTWEDKFSEHQFGGLRAVSAAESQGKGSREIIVVTDSDVILNETKRKHTVYQERVRF